MKILLSLLLAMLGTGLIVTAFAAPISGPSGENAGGLFATYFSNLANNPCTGSDILTGVNNTPGTNYIKPSCTGFGPLIARFFAGFTGPTESEVLAGFSTTTGAPIYKTVSSGWKNVTGGIAYTGGKVGIGTTNLGFQVDIVASDYNHLRLGGGIPLMKFANPNFNGGDGAEFWQDNVGRIFINAHSSMNVLTMTSSGAVGIGTYSPTSKLDVNGNTRVQGDISVNGLLIGGKRLSIPPVCTGATKYLQWDGDNWLCTTLTSSETTTPTAPTTPTYSSPNIVYTTGPDLATPTSSYMKGSYLYGYITGGNPSDTWGCIDIPSGTECPSGRGWRKLGVPYTDPASGTTKTDEWQNTASGLQLKTGLYIDTYFPDGLYTGYVRTGTTGTPVSTTFTVSSPPAPVVTCYPDMYVCGTQMCGSWPNQYACGDMLCTTGTQTCY